MEQRTQPAFVLNLCNIISLVGEQGCSLQSSISNKLSCTKFVTSVIAAANFKLDRIKSKMKKLNVKRACMFVTGADCSIRIRRGDGCRERVHLNLFIWKNVYK